MREKKTLPQLRVLNPARTEFLTRKCESATESDKRVLHYIESLLLKVLGVVDGAGHSGHISPSWRNRSVFSVLRCTMEAKDQRDGVSAASGPARSSVTGI